MVSAPPEGDHAYATLDVNQVWRSSAPAAVRKAWSRGERDAAWRAWRADLAGRKARRGKDLAWGLAAADAAGFALWQVSALAQPAGVAAAWLDQLGDRETSVALALESIHWGSNLASLAGTLEAELWWGLLRTLASLAEEALAAHAPECEAAGACVVDQLLAGELPLVLSQSLPELRPLHELAAPARTALSAGIERMTDGEGLLHAALWTDREVPAASLLLACWTRCRSLTGDSKPWTPDAQLQYEWLVRQSLRAADRHGRLAFGPAEACGAAELLRQAVALGGDPSDFSAASARLKGFRSGDGSYEAPSPSNHSEWAELGVLAAGWRDKGPRIVVAHPADSMRLEVRFGKHPLLAGDWPIEASIAGQPVRPTGGWDCQCWYTDTDCDYLELSLPLAGGGRLERQFFLAREDGVGFLAEALFSGAADARPLAITSRMPLAPAVSLRPERDTRDALLTVSGEPTAGLLPLALPEWRDDPRGGELTAEANALVLRRTHTGRNAVSPLWIDFAPRRFQKQRTWRQLTVAQSLKVVSQDVAVGYRAQSAKHQWLVYRSLDTPANRTVLGQNYSSEMVVGRFNAPDGLVEPYFEVETE